MSLWLRVHQFSLAFLFENKAEQEWLQWPPDVQRETWDTATDEPVWLWNGLACI